MTQYEFRVEIQRLADGARFPTAAVPMGILGEVREQAIFLGQRRGLIGADSSPAEVDVELVRPDPKDRAVQSIKLTAGKGDHRVELAFGIELFATQAQVAAGSLAKQGQLQKADKFLYRVYADEADGKTMTLPGVVVRNSRKPLALVAGRLGDWLGRAMPVGPVSDRDYPLFITEGAIDQARGYCRKPVDKEGGAMLLGHLYQQQEPEPEIFGVIDAAIEARYAEQKLFSLNLTTESYADLEVQLRLRRTRLGRPSETKLGFAHAQRFLPSVLDDGQAQCPTCALRPTCQLNSSFYSGDDVQFHRALFSKAPFAVGIVWGYTPREEDVVKVFCLDGNQPRERGYYRVKD